MALQDIIKFKESVEVDNMILVSANAGLRYPITMKNGKVHVLQFNKGTCAVPKTDKDVCEAVSDFLKNAKKKNLQIPFTSYEDFEEAIATTPISIKLPTGHIVEITPRQIGQIIDKQLKEESKEKGK